jgi:nucleotide-binding universal stress UspA family protein
MGEMTELVNEVPGSRTGTGSIPSEPSAMNRPQPVGAIPGGRGIIVVGLDGSAESRLAVTWAADEANRRKSVLRMVYAGAGRDQPVPEWYSGTRATMTGPQAILDDAFALAATRHASVLLETELPNGWPARALLRASGQADLLVVGAPGRTGIKERLFGSVSQRCIERADCPVVVVRTEPELSTDEMRIPRIVVGIDGSARSDRALRWALREAEFTSATVEGVFACVIAPMTGFINATTQGYDLAGRPVVDEALARASEWQPGVTFWADARFDATVPALLDSCHDAALLVVGSSTHGRHHHFALGSVAEQCARHSRCPVAVIR